LRLLAARSRTEHELRRALERAGYSGEERESAVARLRELGYLNDPEVARTRARALLERGSGPALSRRRLEEQGIESSHATAAVAEAAEGESEDELARRAVERKLRGRPAQDEPEKLRILRALVRKGHRPAAVARALGIDWDGDDDI
jgi:regulatory protein